MRVKIYHRKDSSYTTMIKKEVSVKVSVKDWDRLDIHRESIHKGHLLAFQHQGIFS